MAKFKFIDPNYSPAHELWSMTCHCTELRDELREIVHYDKSLGERIEYHQVMISLIKFQKDLQVLRNFSSRQTFKVISETSETWLPFPEVDE